MQGYDRYLVGLVKNPERGQGDPSSAVSLVDVNLIDVDPIAQGVNAVTDVANELAIQLDARERVGTRENEIAPMRFRAFGYQLDLRGTLVQTFGLASMEEITDWVEKRHVVKLPKKW